jgi:hypothetical protein
MASLEKLLSLSHRGVVDGLNCLAAGGAATVSIFGAVDANMLQAWGGALVGVASAMWSLWRDQRRRDKVEEDRIKKAARHEKWDTFITEIRMKGIAENGVDPFAHGAPPLDFMESIEAAYVTTIQTAATKPSGTQKPAETTESKPPRPRWADAVRHLFG